MFFKTLPDSAQRIFARLGRARFSKPFYLAGGSAAALHLGHRISVDLDFFTPTKFVISKLTQQLGKIGAVTVQQEGEGTFVGTLADTKISFFFYGYSLLDPATTFQGVRLASLLDIALMKIIAISQRGRRRDFIDLYFICKQAGFDLNHLFAQIPRKYSTLSYPSYHLIRALTYFDDAEKDSPPKMLARSNWKQIRSFYEQQAGDLMREI